MSSTNHMKRTKPGKNCTVSIFLYTLGIIKNTLLTLDLNYSDSQNHFYRALILVESMRTFLEKFEQIVELHETRGLSVRTN